MAERLELITALQIKPTHLLLGNTKVDVRLDETGMMIEAGIESQETVMIEIETIIEDIEEDLGLTRRLGLDLGHILDLDQDQGTVEEGVIEDLAEIPIDTKEHMDTGTTVVEELEATRTIVGVEVGHIGGDKIL